MEKNPPSELPLPIHQPYPTPSGPKTVLNVRGPAAPAPKVPQPPRPPRLPKMATSYPANEAGLQVSVQKARELLKLEKARADQLHSALGKATYAIDTLTARVTACEAKSLELVEANHNLFEKLSDAQVELANTSTRCGELAERIEKSGALALEKIKESYAEFTKQVLEVASRAVSEMHTAEEAESKNRETASLALARRFEAEMSGEISKVEEKVMSLIGMMKDARLAAATDSASMAAVSGTGS